jgi:tRNA threonylcarbamoyladenosine biosynthesis protein TsaE
MFSRKVKSTDELPEVAKQFMHTFCDQRVFAFSGELGAGKTTFIKALCNVMGSKDYVTSPSFALVNEYTGKDGFPVFHFDFYRIKEIEEIFDIGFEEYIYSGHYCFIEWPEIVDPLLSGDIVEVSISADDTGVRTISARFKT